MNIWTQLLSLNGHPLEGEFTRSFADPVGASQPQTPARHDRLDRETEAARRAIPLWRPAPWIAIR